MNKKLAFGSRFFFILFLILMIPAFLIETGVCVVMYPAALATFAVFVIAGTIIMKKCISKNNTGSRDSKYNRVILVLFLLMVIISLVAGWFMEVLPGNDRNVIFHQAKDIADSGVFKSSPQWNYYFLRYPNNRILVLVEAFYFSFVKALGFQDYLTANMILNILMIDLSVFLLVRLAGKIWNKKIQLYMMCACFLFAPFYLYGPFVYTDSLTLPLVIGAVFLYYRTIYRKKKLTAAAAILPSAGIAVIIWFGYSLKATVAILLVAFVLHLLCIRKLRGIFPAALMIAVFIALQLSSQTALKQAAVFDETNYETENFPYTHWIMMGLTGKGNYKKPERQFTSSFETRNEKEEATKKTISETLKKYGFPGLIKHQIVKNGYTFSNGTYDMDIYLQKDPVRSSIFDKFVYADSKYAKLFKIYTEGFHLCMIFFLIISLIAGLKKKRVNLFAVLALSLFGLCLFLQLWETRPRYLFHFIPIIFLLAVDGQVQFAGLFGHKSQK